MTVHRRSPFTVHARGIVTAARLFWLPALLMFAACGTEVVRHEMRLTIRDSTNRLGAPPWHVEAGGRGSNPAGYASPESPFRESFTEIDGSRDRLLSARSSTQQIVLRIPALGRGVWHGIVLVSDDGTCEGYARYSDIGPPQADAETLFLRGTAKPNPNGNGWSFDLRTEIPAAPTTELITAKLVRRLARVVPRQGTCSFGGGMEGYPTVPLEPDAKVVVLVNGDTKHQALTRSWMEALLRAGGCGVVDHARIDATLQQQLERNPKSLAVLNQISQASGATMVLMEDQKTGMAQLIEIATAKVPIMWPTRD
jgi:hypothetical protein